MGRAAATRAAALAFVLLLALLPGVLLLPTATAARSASLEFSPMDFKEMRRVAIALDKPKLLLFTIFKIGTTEFRRLAYRAIGDPYWFLPPHFRARYEGTPEFVVSTGERLAEILTDDSWTKAVFLRDPAERFLSAYLDKVKVYPVGHRKNFYYSQARFNVATNLTFEEFVELVASPYPQPAGLTASSDVHWRPQAEGGHLGRILQHFNFVGKFPFIQEHSEVLLREKGLWDVGAHGWVDVSNFNADWHKDKFLSRVKIGFRRPAASYLEEFHNVSFFQRADARHATWATDKIMRFYSDATLAKVKRAYKVDYDMLAAIGMDFADPKPLRADAIRRYQPPDERTPKPCWIGCPWLITCHQPPYHEACEVDPGRAGRFGDRNSLGSVRVVLADGVERMLGCRRPGEKVPVYSVLCPDANWPVGEPAEDIFRVRNTYRFGKTADGRLAAPTIHPDMIPKYAAAGVFPPYQE